MPILVLSQQSFVFTIMCFSLIIQQYHSADVLTITSWTLYWSLNRRIMHLDHRAGWTVQTAGMDGYCCNLLAKKQISVLCLTSQTALNIIVYIGFHIKLAWPFFILVCAPPPSSSSSLHMYIQSDLMTVLKHFGGFLGRQKTTSQRRSPILQPQSKHTSHSSKINI